MSQKGSLEVRPDSIIFRDLEPGDTDSIEVWARNSGKRPVHIRFSMDENPFFSLICKANIMTAPGLDAHAVVKFTASTATIEECQLKIECNDSTVFVPIYAYPPAPSFQIDKKLINFGTVLVNSSQIQHFRMNNCGTTSGEFELKCDESCVFLEPRTGSLDPNSSIDVSVTFKSNEPGSYKIPIVPVVEGNHDPLPEIHVCCNVVDHSIELNTVDGEPIRDLDFGYLFHGQKKQMTVKLVNKGGIERKFAIEQPTLDVSGRRSTTNGPRGKVFSVSPANGSLQPYSSVELTVTYAPPAKTAGNDAEQVHSSLMTASVVETGQVLELSLQGTAVQIEFEVSAVDFDFHDVVVKNKAKESFTLTNLSKNLALPFAVKGVAHCTFTPDSGHIPPEKSQEIVISFCPKTLGPFNCNTVVSFCQGLRQRGLNLSGCAVMANDGKSFERADVWEADSNAAWNVTHPSSSFALTLDEIQKKKERRKEFDGYITESAKIRAEKEAIKKVRREATIRARQVMQMTDAKYTDEDIKEFVDTQIRQKLVDGDDPVNLGMGHCEGMVPPDPPLLRIAEPMKTKKRELRPASPRDSTAAVEKPFDDKVLMKKKFKLVPTTNTEISDCSRRLQQAQQLLVVASHETIDFGTVSVFSTEARSFQVTNNLQFHILVTMKYDCEELKGSTPESQVVPPHQTCGFDIVLSSDRSQKFQRSIHYIINNDLLYSVNILADIVPIDVSVSPELLVFEFPEDYARPYLKQFLTLQNNSNSFAEFAWSGFDSVFTTHNSSGTIAPHGKYTAEITYRPDQNPHVEGSAKLEVKGGPSRHLKMIGNTGKARLVLNKKVLPFGLLALDDPRTLDIRIKNNGPDDGIFTITPNLTDVITITPALGRVKVGEQVDIHVRVRCLKTGAFEIPVSVAVCGTTPLQFTITGQAELPRVALKADPLDYGLVYVGGSASKTVTIENVGCIPAIVFVDLSKFPVFHLDYESDLKKSDSDKTNSIAIVTDTRLGVSPSPSTMSITPTTQSNSNSTASPGFIYRLKIMKSSSITFSLVFQPRSPESYSFTLPVSVVSIEAGEDLQPAVKASSLRAPLFLSDSSINFGVCPLYDAENPNNRPPLRQLVIKNEYKRDVEYRIGQPQSEEFTVESPAGTVKYATSTTVFITFKPSAARPFTCFVPVYVTTENGESLVSEVQLMGIGSYRRFVPSVSYVSLPIVPLGVKSERTIRVINSGSIRAELKTDMPIIEKQFPLSVQFTEGNLFEFSTRYLPLNISFCSTRPMSFTTRVAIVDDLGDTAAVTVSAATDNSIFTLYPLLSMKCYRVSSSQGKPITAVLTKTDLESEFLAHVMACDDLLKLKPTETTVTPQMTDFLFRFLNSVLLTTKMKRFPDDIAVSGGEIVLDIINSLAGSKKVNTGGVLGQSSKDRKKLDQMKSLIQFLKTQGAILPNVAPEFLLPKADFADVMRAKIQKQLLGLDYYGAPDISSYGDVADEYISAPAFTQALVSRLKVVDDLYRTISTEAWTQVVLQVLKLFLFSKVDGDKLSQVAGVSTALEVIKPLVDNVMFAEINRPPKALGGSNIFTTSECGLLKWATIHYCASHGGYSDIVNDFAQLHDPKYILTLIKSHLTKYNIEIIEDAKTTEDYQKNLESIFTALNQAKAPFVPTANDIIQGSHFTLALIMYQLLESLPHFIPSTDIVFDAALSSRSVQKISITNPSSKNEITYSASLEGSSNFKVAENTIVLGPSQTVDLEVSYFARTYSNEQAVLSLIPEKPKVTEPKEQKPATAPARRANQKAKPEPVATPSTVVINLTSNVVVSRPLEIVHVEGPIYGTTKMSFNVKNGARVQGKYKVIPKFVDVSDDRRNVPALLKKFLKKPVRQIDPEDTPSSYIEMLKRHKHFLFVQKKIVFSDGDSTEKIDLEFIPISLGEFHCFLLFYNPDLGEFVYEIVGKSTLPQAQTNSLALKTESGKTVSNKMGIDPVNKFLFQAVGYSLTRSAALKNYMSDAKFQDSMSFHVRELQNLYISAMSSVEFQVENTSPEYFTTPETFTLTRVLNLEKPNPNQNVLPVEFSPVGAGEYPCRILMRSKYDVRIYLFKAIGISATKNLSLEMITSSGKTMVQEVPFVNPSDDIWHFKVTLTGSECFTVPQKFSAAPKSTGILTVSMKSGEIGKYSAEMTVVNLDKEATYKYTISGEVTDPSAEEKIMIRCRARERHRQTLDIKPLVSNGTVDVTSTVPLLNCPKKARFEDDKLAEPFEVSVYAARSGVSTGTITFTDPETKAYSWYVVDLCVDPPHPEEILPVKTICRKTVTVNIPVSNPKSVPVNIDVNISDPDLYGDKSFTVNPKETVTYSLVFSPLVVSKRQSKVSFFNSEEGEFIYILDINVEASAPCVMSQMVAAIGQHASTFVLLENPVGRDAWMEVVNDNPGSFQVLTDNNRVNLRAREKRQIEIRYIPSSVGMKEASTIGFTSNDIGDWFYKLSGVGKPPQPLSPIIVEAMLELSSSGQVIFTNPFPRMTRYEISLTSTDRNTFNLLTKRKTFTLSEYGEQFQIAFSFSPTRIGQFQATILVTTLGMTPEVRWTFPVIGNTILGDENEIPAMKGKAGQHITHKMEFPLVGEKEQFKDSDYQLTIEYPAGYEWMRSAISTQPLVLERNGGTPTIFVTLDCFPRKPANVTLQIIISNPLGQRWRFSFRAHITRAGVMKTITIESPLNCLTQHRVTIDEPIHQRTRFTADFAPGTCEEFDLSPNHGVIEASLQPRNELPFDILFKPTTYGKQMRGILIIDTIDVEYIIEVIGRLPSYVPPLVMKSGKINTTMPESAVRLSETQGGRRRNIIRDNIDNVKLSRPNTVRSLKLGKAPFRH